MGASARREVRLRLPHGRRASAARSGPATGFSRSRTRRPTCGRRSSARASAATRPTTSTSTSATRSRTNRMTIDLGLRYDHQWGKALPSETLANTAFPNVVPGLSFTGYDTPFTWKNFSPRAGVTYALDESRKTVARASFSRYAGQLETGTVGVHEPELDGRLGDLSLGRPQRRSLRAGERGAAEPVHHRGRRLQPGEPDGGHLGQRARSEPEGAADHQLRRRRRPRAAAEPGGAGELQLHADQRSVRQLHRPDHAARRRDARRLRAGQRASPARCPTAPPTTCRPSSRTRRRWPPAATAS